MILLDTSGLLSLLDVGEPEHASAMACVKDNPGPLLVTDLVLAEVDFLILKRLGREAEARFLDQVVAGALQREAVTADDLEQARTIIDRHADQALSLTDTTLMAIATRLHPCPVFTFDRRHFAPFRDGRGRALTLLP